ncbi:tetratricopeptide repeat protein SKI3 isoform X1 [Capsicum annuum]|uniref:tetratricopeptide repeat protein SKI3 isoform X1 n=1 Tax=Capsicum annuum TaxID=4072 RepID=UPI0007BFC41E|nr:tetratricopeptide repeat protein SKI3 isoform X1 [Capsicum annuum]XP_016568180.1 tetratricopeptide repeat protein SKI3 isoform X1 [Capsicum annuum]
MGEEDDTAAAIRGLEEAVISEPGDPCLHFDLGMLLWDKAASAGGGGGGELREKAAQHFLTAAKLNPQNAAAFTYLGHYYARVSLDSQRAIKCYQRALSLNPHDSIAGEAICDLLDSTGKETLQIAVCREASDNSPRAFWAFSRLGYLLVNQNKWSEAAQCLQQAIRGYPTCADLWEALGLSYQQMGMFTAAVKSYGRAIELEESRVFALVESGNVYLMLGSFRKGIEQFRQALQISPMNLSAHHGLASALLSLAKESIDSGAFKLGASLLEEASKVALASTSIVGNISCAWKLLGDIQVTYAKCFPWMDEGMGLGADENSFTSLILSWKRMCCVAVRSACCSYQRALHLSPWQANVYTDVAIASELLFSLRENSKADMNSWFVSEKMCLGGLLLEGCNSEFWVALGCLSDHSALKQHAFIRALQLDVSLAVAWAHLGKLYRLEGESQLSQLAFDRARSIDPSLSLPWAGMSADASARNMKPDEAYECCLRAVQIFPLAEFQTGLVKLALHSGYLQSPEAFGAIQQALQRAPQYPESHNLKGLVCEARSDYDSAVASYRLARVAARVFAGKLPKSYLADISINLTRSLCKAGNADDAIEECKYLESKGLLDVEGLQLYTLSYWKLGKYDLALSMAKRLASSALPTEHPLAAASLSFICRLVYHISGQELAIRNILQLPKRAFQSSKVRLVASAMHALDESHQLDSVVSSVHESLSSSKEIAALDFLATLGLLVKHGSQDYLEVKKGVNYLRRALHISPNSHLIRTLLGYLLVSSKEWKDVHISARCFIVDPSEHQKKEGFKSSVEIFGAGAVACCTVRSGNKTLPMSICRENSKLACKTIKMLQKCVHQEPWDHHSYYLLVLNYFQQAREEKFPHNLCVVLERLINVSLQSEFYAKEDISSQYQKFQLLLCAAEVSLQCGNNFECIMHAKSALQMQLSDNYLFFAHLLLCRAYAVENNYVGLHEEYVRCLEVKTDYHIGWICLKFLESRYKLHSDSSSLALAFQECSKEIKTSWNMWIAIYNLVQGLTAVWNGEFIGAEESLAQACSLASGESCLFLSHGAICMEIARLQSDSEFLSLAIRSLKKAKDSSSLPLPFVSLLLAQAEASLGSESKWEKNLIEEWSSWRPEIRPAELFFQMHLLARRLKEGSAAISNLEPATSPLRWILQAIHMNPSCLRYWRALLKLFDN